MTTVRALFPATRAMIQTCTRYAIAVLMIALTCGSAYAQSGGDGQQETITVEYHGELLDEDNKPISGIFPLTFRFYGSEESDRPAWSEQQFVSVHLGEYIVDLGTNEPITSQLEGRDVYLAVELEGVGEIVRHSFTVNPDKPVGPNSPTVENIETLEFADVADRALYAERARVAEDCERLGGLTADDLNRFAELERELQQLRQKVQQLESEGGGGGGRIGDRTITLEAAGGDGGTPYRYTCPPNHVAVGMTGTNGNLVDSAALICAPLE